MHAHIRKCTDTPQCEWLDPRCSPHSPALWGSWVLPPVRLFRDVFTSLSMNSPAVTKTTCRKKKAKNSSFIPPATPDMLGQKWGRKKLNATAELMQRLKYPSCCLPPRSLSLHFRSRNWPPRYTPLLVCRPLQQRNWHFSHVVTWTSSFKLSYFIVSMSLELTVTVP